jgi:hypothetical protein
MRRHGMRLAVVATLAASYASAAVAAPQDAQRSRSGRPATSGTAGVIQPRGAVDPHMTVRKPPSRPEDMPVIKPEPARPDGGERVVPR